MPWAEDGVPRTPGCSSDALPGPPRRQVAEILGTILVHLPVVEHPEVRGLLVEGVLLLAHYHQETVLTLLLRQPLPMERCVRWWGRLLCNPDRARGTCARASRRTRASRGLV